MSLTSRQQDELFLVKERVAARYRDREMTHEMVNEMVNEMNALLTETHLVNKSTDQSILQGTIIVDPYVLDPTAVTFTMAYSKPTTKDIEDRINEVLGEHPDPDNTILDRLRFITNIVVSLYNDAGGRNTKGYDVTSEHHKNLSSMAFVLICYNQQFTITITKYGRYVTTGPKL